MTSKKFILIFGMLLVLSLVLAADSTSFGGGVPTSFSGNNYRVYGASVNPQFTQPSFYGGLELSPQEYWGNFNREDCKERQDVILMIPPGGCSPAVVRSDLLEEQNVPVFCKVSSIQVNPLIDITKIRSIHFVGKNPPGVAGISYYPARAAIRSDSKLIGSPIVDNVGYVVISLKKTPAEKDMLDWVGGNLTAVIDYDSEGVFGVGQHDFYLTETNDEEWQNQYKSYGFWKGKGYVRLEALDEDSARISIYKDATEREASVDIKKGETSRDIYLGGYYCAAGMNIKVEDIGYPVDTALLRVDDEDLWLGKGSKFLNGKCTVSNLEVYDVGGGKVSLSCTGAGRFDLRLDSPDVSIEGGDKQEGTYSVGDKVKTTSAGNIYLAYVGKFSNDKSNYAVLIKSSDDSNVFLQRGLASVIARQAESYQSNWAITRLLKNIGEWAFGFENYLKEKISGKGIEKDNIKILRVNEEWDVGEVKIKLISKFSSITQLEENQLLKENYENAVNNYNEVFNLYPSEKERLDDDNLDPYAVTALYNSATLSGLLGLQTKQIEYLEKLIENYPGSKLAKAAESELEKAYKNRFSADSQAIVYVNNEPHFISLIDIKKPSYDNLGAELSFVNNKGQATGTLTLKKDTRQIIPGTENETSGKGIPIEVTEIKEDSVTIKYYPPEKGIANWLWDKTSGIVVGSDVHGETMNLEAGKLTQLTQNISVKLVKTNLEKTAKVKIIPKVFGTRTESNFSFKIGIEKRGIKLSPEKTQEMIDTLGKTIKQWEDINEKLGKVVTGLKGACFATSAMLVVKNFFSGMSGESMARNEVMTMEGGWNDKCRQWSGKSAVQSPEGKTYTSVQACLLDNNDKINTAVSQYAAIIKQENELMKKLEAQPGIKQAGDILDWQGQVNSEKLKQEYCKTYFKPIYNQNDKIDIKGVDGKVLLKDVIEPSRVENCSVDLEDMKMLVMKKKIDATTDPVLKEVINNKLKTGLRNTYDVNRLVKNEDILKNTFGKDAPVANFEIGKKEYQVMASVSGITDSSLKTNLGDSTRYFTARINNEKNVAVGLVKVGDDYQVNKIIEKTSIGFKDISNDNFIAATANIPEVKYKDYYKYNQITQFTELNSNLYNSKFKEAPKVKYYERAPYQGLPAQVPIGKVGQTDGWYVMSDYILSGFGKPYEENGRAVNFWVCNAGEDGLIDGKNRDDCRYYNLGSGADLKFPGLSGSDSAILVSKAEKAIRDASSQYGKSKVTINNQVFETEIAENGESGNCADFMSPSDCNLMFNVCDPVMCPESRCDFGGKYRVDNVIQSGIIGSLLLCLPNFPEVKVPICLSGVHAGIEGYLSILKSTQACLNESLVTGRNIGICDEIKSIYMCEFFWRQAAPLINVAIPNLFELVLGQGARGGGEYLTIDYAWKNVQNSIDYFKNEYAVNAMKAFNDRSTAGVGEEVCKSFVSAQYPSGDLIGNLLEPDSPVQYHAWFSEDVLTEATIPPTSHYKVYYHIYAGKDIGSHYVVYLKSPPESNLVHTLGVYVVDRGYIAKGQQVDNARDFTGISGYKELCISINGQDECGFKQVSTSWAVEELSRQYAADQAKDRVTKASECVAGEPSIYSLANPNLQTGVQETISPELYKRGIIRVCSSENPGKSVDTNTGQIDPTNSSFDRWMRVGYCDTSAVGCWIDTQSVKNVLSDAPGLLNETLSNVSLGYVGTPETMLPADAENIFKKAKELLAKITSENKEDGWITEDLTETTIDGKITPIITSLNDITNRGIDNKYKANAFFLIGQIYDKITRKVYEPIMKAKTDAATKAAQTTGTETQPTGTGTENQPKEEGRIYFKENWATGSWPIVNNLTFVKYEIDLVDTKFVKSIDNQILYYTTDKTEDKLGGTWRAPDSLQTNTYNSRKDFFSNEIRINIYKGFGFSSSSLVNISTYKKLNNNGIDTKFIKSNDNKILYFSVDGGVTWKEADPELIIVYKESIETEKIGEGLETNQKKTIRIIVGNWISSSSPEVLVDSYAELNVNGIKTKFVKSADEKAIYTSTNFEVNKFEGYWKKANSEQLQVYLNSAREPETTPKLVYNQNSIFIMKTSTFVKYYTFIDGTWRYKQYNAVLTEEGIKKIDWSKAEVAFAGSIPDISKDFEEGVYVLQLQQSSAETELNAKLSVVESVVGGEDTRLYAAQ